MTNNALTERFEEMTSHLRNGGLIQIATYARATVYDKRHVEMFKQDEKGIYVRQGKNWNCIATPSMNLVAIRFGRVVNN